MMSSTRLISLPLITLMFSIFISAVQSLNCFDEPNIASSKIVFITSFGSSFYHHVTKNGDQHTVIHNIPKDHTLIVYHEDEIPDIPGTCKMSLFDAVPGLETELTDPESGINKYFKLATYFDPLNANIKPGALDSGKILMLKVAAINHGVKSARDGQVVMWLDTDVSFREEVPDRVIDWLGARDVTYIPMYFQDHNSNPFDTYDFTSPSEEIRALNEQYWRVESGIVAFTANDKTRALTDKALEMYRGGLYELAQICFQRNPTCTLTERVGANVYTNDVFIWALLLMSDIHNDDLFHVGLKHGWFAWKGLKAWGDPESQHVYGNYFWQPGFVPSERPDSLITNFYIGEYIFHHFGTHQKGALSIQQHEHDSTEASWRRIKDPGVKSQSLYTFLGDF